MQAPGFIRYLSLIPVLATILTLVPVVAWMLINFYYPDLLFHPLP
ncbi:PsaJ protein [Pannus brasiliensis CCIBt3594]|uniref:PsaJ protein n=1 Tax=Pannus brasiliensis CCIBt3594 TaxID=1427578 RepID=A0AAW9QV20_9CHRO